MVVKYKITSHDGHMPITFLKKVGQKIGKVRVRKGYTQVQLAEKAGVSIQTVQYWESGQNITLKTLKNLAVHLNHPVHEFLKDLPRSLTRQGRPSKKTKTKKTP